MGSKLWSAINYNLLCQLIGKSAEELARVEAERQGIKIAKVEQIVLDSDAFIEGGELRGEKVTLEDGRVYVPKLVRTFMGDDYGHDTYEYRLENEEVTRLLC